MRSTTNSFARNYVRAKRRQRLSCLRTIAIQSYQLQHVYNLENYEVADDEALDRLFSWLDTPEKAADNAQVK